MELTIIILSILVALLFYKIRMLNKHLAVLSFAERNINKLLVKKGLIKTADIDTIINESIGDMPEDTGNELIKSAKSIGVIIPKYMDKEELKVCIENQELRRRNAEISFTDRMIMRDLEK